MTNHRPPARASRTFSPKKTPYPREVRHTLAPDSLAWALLTAAGCVNEVIAYGRSLTAVLQQLRQQTLPENAVRAQAIDLTYATLRRYARAEIELSVLLDRPTAEDELRSLLRVALCWLEMHPERAHVGVDQAVEAAATLSAGRYRGFVNAILRRALRERVVLDQAIARDPEEQWQCPLWWLERLQADWPNDWQTIASAGNRKPPMALRVNTTVITPEAYVQSLALAGIPLQPRQNEERSESVLLVQPLAADQLPGWAAGKVAIQDLGAQRAAGLLPLKDGMRVLDACAAPGGKAAHLLEIAAIDLTAVESDADRYNALCHALNAARFPADRRVRVVHADATQPTEDWAAQPFDAILLDAPCSGSGVAGRHPDAKWLRRNDDVYAVARTQKKLLQSLWPHLKPGGQLLYGTCSVFAWENQAQITRFLAQHPDAQLTSQTSLLPSARHDGFFYALLTKAAL